MKQLTNITKNQVAMKGVQALADRPNEGAQYGTGGLSATQLKLWFDKLATFLTEKINEIHTALSSEEAADYIRVMLDEYGIGSLGDLIEALSDGSFSEKLPLVYPTLGAEEQQSLQSAFYTISKENTEANEKLWKEINTLGYGYTAASASFESDGGEFAVDLQIRNLTYGKELHFCFRNLVQAVVDELPVYGGETT